MLPTIDARVVADPAGQTIEHIETLGRWALQRPHDDAAAGGVLSAISWLADQAGTAPDHARPVWSEYAMARGALRLSRGTAERHALGVSLVLAVAVGELGAIPDLLRMFGPNGPIREAPATADQATGHTLV
jgi:hypothetical protein